MSTYKRVPARLKAPHPKKNVLMQGEYTAEATSAEKIERTINHINNGPDGMIVGIAKPKRSTKASLRKFFSNKSNFRTK